MNSVGKQRLGRPPTLAQRALSENPRLVHAVTSCTSPTTRPRVRPVASRNTSSSVGSLARPAALAQIRLEPGRRPLAHDPAVVDDREPVTQLVRLLQVLGREEDGRAALVDPAHLVPDREPARGVEPGRGLVEEQHLRLVHERRRQIEPALHPAGVALDQPVGRVLELHQLEQLLRALEAPRAGEAEQPPLQNEQLAPALARIEPGLLERDPDAATHRIGLAGHVHTRHLRGARGDRQQRREHAHGRRLARAVRSQEAEHLSGLDPQVDASNRLDVSRSGWDSA